MSTKMGIIKGLDDGIFSQAKRDSAADKNLTPGALHWLSRKVLETYQEEGKDYQGQDVNAAADLQAHVDQFMAKCGVTAASRNAGAVKAAAIETYGITRELQARGIRPEVDTGAKFFGPGAGENSPLFPPMLASSFIVARLSSGLIDLMAFADVTVNELSVNKVRLSETEANRSMRNVAIGGTLPKAELAHVDTNVKMRKYGRLFEYAREVVESQPLAVVQAMVGQIARQVAIDETDEGLEILHAGDGESGSAVTDTTPQTDATLVYGDLITLELAFGNGYMGKVFLTGSTPFQTILNMSEYKDPLSNRGVRMERNIPAVPSPSGAGLIWRWQSTNSTYMAESGGRVAAIDPSIAMYVARSPMLEEQDTLIASGKQQVALSYRMAVIKGDPNAFKSLDITA